MTLTLTGFFGPQLIVHVSDRRLWYPPARQREHNDGAVKIINFERPEERLVVSHCGLAEFVGPDQFTRYRPIERWLGDALASVPETAPVGHVLSTLARGLDFEIAKARRAWPNEADQSFRTSVTLVGFDQKDG